MALKATIYKAELQLADMNRHHYQTYQLTLARHPSETDLRMMVRLLTFAMHAHERLEFCRGLSTDDEPDLWLKDLSDNIELWIELGQPDEKRIRKACGRAKQVVIYPYQRRSAKVWWQQLADKLERFENLSVIELPEAVCQELAGLAKRNMQLQCSIQDNQCWLADEQTSVVIEPNRWKTAD